MIFSTDVVQVRNRQGRFLPAGEPAATASAMQTSSLTTTTTPTTITTRKPLFAMGTSSRSAVRLLAQRFDLLGEDIDRPLVA